jgi:hypothetical protein
MKKPPCGGPVYIDSDRLSRAVGVISPHRAVSGNSIPIGMESRAFPPLVEAPDYFSSS